MNAEALLLERTLEPETAQIARGLRARNPDVLDRLIEAYQFRLFRYLLLLTGNRASAEDFFQETWLRVLERGHQYDGRWKFESWLFTVARNLVIDRMRRKREQSLDALLDPENSGPPRELPGKGPSPFDELLAQEQTRRAGWAMEQLPAAYREVLNLRFQEDLQLDEIARITGGNLSSVKSRLYRGLALLRELVEEKRA